MRCTLKAGCAVQIPATGLVARAMKLSHKLLACTRSFVSTAAVPYLLLAPFLDGWMGLCVAGWRLVYI